MAREPESNKPQDGAVPATAARQGRTNVGVRQVLAASLVLVVIGFILAYILS